MEKTLFNKKENKYFSTELYFEFCGISKTLPLHSFGPATRKNFIVHVVLEGEGVYYVKNKRYHLKKGDLFCIRPNESTFYQSDALNPWVYAWLSFGGKVAEEIIQLSKFQEDVYSFSSTQTAEYTKIILSCLKLNHDTFEEELQLNELTYRLVNLLLSDGGHAVYHTEKSFSPLSLKAMEYIETHFQENFTIQELADILAVNRSYLSRVFSKDLGLSIKKYLTGVRVNRSATLLAMSEESIENIGYKVGFSGNVSFSRTFHQIVGETPSDYRKRMKIKGTKEDSFQSVIDALDKQSAVSRAT